MSSEPTDASTRGLAFASDPEISSYLGPDDLMRQLREDALAGLTAENKSIPSKWFYDERGSGLFDRITRLPEYYLTRAEKQILVDRAGAIAGLTGAGTLIELGSGTSEKTRLLLDAARRTGFLRRIVPFDVDEATLKVAARELAVRYPEVEVAGLVGDFERHLDAIAMPGRKLVILLGSTIGNLDPAGRARLLADLSDNLEPGDSFLLGVDLVKAAGDIEAAYNDSAGISAEFNLNVLRVLNHRLDGDFNLDRFEHVASFDPTSEQMRMWLRSTTEQQVSLRAIDLRVTFGSSELLHTEISTKFRRTGIERELSSAGLKPAQWWTDRAGRFGLSLSVRL
ncbi:MAG: L-histidine N(alpha)-methyltransferase [Actinomycetota bacterium]